MDIILHKIGLVRIVSSFPSILYFVADMFLKLMEGYVLLKNKKEWFHYQLPNASSLQKKNTLWPTLTHVYMYNHSP